VAGAPLITFLSDYGHADEWVGTCHAVIARIAPGARVIDLGHGFPRHDVVAAALALRHALRYAPPGVHLAVVDPDVGADRRAVAARAGDGRRFVGPDNGLLALALDDAGGAVEAVEIGHSPFRLEPVSATFHGRDLFAPVAARLAAGAELAEAGDPFDAAELRPLELPPPADVGTEEISATVLTRDRFGNIALNVGHEALAGSPLRLGRPVTVSLPGGREVTGHYAYTFADVAAGELLLYEDATRTLALALNRGDAASELGLGAGDRVTLRPV
jgi:S-adenosylmethionine hydrolase